MPQTRNRANLENAAALDLRRPAGAFNGNEKAGFANDAFSMIGERLRSNANEGFVTLTPPNPVTAPGLYLLPDDYAETRAVTTSSADGPVQVLRPLTWGTFDSLAVSAAKPVGYMLVPGFESGTQLLAYTLQVKPTFGGDVLLDYWQYPTGWVSNSSSSSTNPVLTAHFQLCLWGYELFAWQAVQNWDQRDRVQQLFDTELDRINSASNKGRYGAGAAMSAPARFYNSAPSRAM